MSTGHRSPGVASVMAATWTILLACIVPSPASAQPQPMSSHEAPRWPLPPGAAVVPLGDEISAGGPASQVQVFASRQSAEAMADWYRKTLGSALVENRLGQAIVLGRAQGRHYLTALIAPAVSGSRVTLAVSDLAAASSGQSIRDSAGDWARRLPVGSRLISQTHTNVATPSRHGIRRESQWLYANHHGLALNADHLLSLWGQEAWRLEWDEHPSSSGRVLAFQRGGDQALAVIRQRPSGLTTVVVSQSRELERWP